MAVCSDDFELEQLEVSSAAEGHPKEHLLDGDDSTFWKTDSVVGVAPSACKPHWIRLTRRRGACVRELALSVRKVDKNYVPDVVSVFAGEEPGKLVKMLRVQLFDRLATDGCTRVDLLEGARHTSREHRVLEIRIERNVDNGVQSKVHGLHVKFAFPEPASDFLPSLHRLFQEGTCSDVVFRARGEDIHAHRCILVTRSKVMRALLTNGMSETTPGSVIEVADVEPQVLRELLLYLYTDSLSATGAEMADKLLVAADKYQIERLSFLCESRLIETLAVETCCDLLVVGSSLGHVRLSEAALEFALEHAESLLATEGMKRIVAERPELVAELFAAAKLGVKRARSVCEGVGTFVKRARNQADT